MRSILRGAGQSLLLTVLLVTLGALPASAADKDLGSNTLSFFSIDDMAGFRKALDASDTGRFLKDPEVQDIKNRLGDGFMSVISSAIASAGPEESEKLEALSGLLEECCGVAMNKVTGRLAVSLGFQEVEGGAMQPELLVHMQGGEEIDQVLQRLHGFLKDAMSSDGIVSSEFELGGAKVRALQPPEGAAGRGGGPMKEPDGIYFARKGSDYFIGIGKRGLEEYINASGGGSTAVGGRLGQQSDYQRCAAATGPGQMNFYFNTPLVWSLFDKFSAMEPGAGELQMIVDVLGLRSVGGLYGTSTNAANGAQSKMFLGMQGRPGLTKLIPATNSTMSMPPFVPRSVVSATVMRAELSSILDVVYDIAVKVQGEGAKQEIAAGIAEFETETGVKLADILGALEGTVATYTKAGDGAGVGMGGMPGMPTGDFAIGMKLKDSAPMAKFLESLAGNENMGPMIKTEEFLGRKVYIINPMGDVPPEFAAPGSIPTPSLVVDKDWFLIGLSAESVQSALRTADGGEEGRLSSDPEFQALASKTGTSGAGLFYVDTAEYLGGLADMARMFIGMVPFTVPGLAQQPELHFLFNPQNIPQRGVFDRYFGKNVQTWSLVDGGHLFSSWAPSIASSKKK